MEKLTITLTGRPPVRIGKDNWPITAEAHEDDRHGTQIGNEPDRNEKWRIKVRQHEDGRAIVYAIYDYDTLWQNEKCISVRGGQMLDKGDDVIAAIQDVARDMRERVNEAGGSGDVFSRLAHECIADLPAVEVD